MLLYVSDVAKLSIAERFRGRSSTPRCTGTAAANSLLVSRRHGSSGQQLAYSTATAVVAHQAPGNCYAIINVCDIRCLRTDRKASRTARGNQRSFLAPVVHDPD